MITLVVAIWGAVTGTLGAGVALASRRDAVWARRARALRIRGDVEAIRDVLAEAKADPSRAATLTGNNAFRARVQVVQDEIQRCPDRKVRRHLSALSNSCLTLTNSAANAQGAVSYNVTSAVDRAMAAAEAILIRIAELDRRAPTN